MNVVSAFDRVVLMLSCKQLFYTPRTLYLIVFNAHWPTAVVTRVVTEATMDIVHRSGGSGAIALVATHSRTKPPKVTKPFSLSSLFSSNVDGVSSTEIGERPCVIACRVLIISPCNQMEKYLCSSYRRVLCSHVC